MKIIVGTIHELSLQGFGSYAHLITTRYIPIVGEIYVACFPKGIAPIEYPVQDMEVILLDENGAKVENGNIGEIALRSEYLALGYWQKPELTKTVFLSDIQNHKKRIYRTGDLGCIQTDGCLANKGRKDFQVKICGFRIEVAEIEMELLKMTNIKEAVVIATEDTPENKRLIAYLVAKQKSAPTTKQIRTFLQDKLPEYILPSGFIFLDALPLTPNQW